MTFQYRRLGDAIWVNIGPVDVAAPWSAEWQTASLLDGEFELRAVAMDNVGNADEEAEAIQVVVRNVTVVGDADCSGNVDFDDINAFVRAIASETAYRAQYPRCHWLNADTNCDGAVDFDDINPFVTCLSGGHCGCPPPVVRGDLDCDGAVDFDDIGPFVTALVGQAVYEAKYPDCRWLNGDIDGNGAVDFDDINPFVKLLIGGG